MRLVEEVATDRKQREARRAHPAGDDAIRNRLRQRTQERVDDSLRRFMVPGDERRARAGIEQRSGLGQDLERAQ